MFSLDENGQQESLHLFGLGHDVVERLQQLLQLLHPWVGLEEARDDVLGISVDLLQADDVNIGQLLVCEAEVNI